MGDHAAQPNGGVLRRHTLIVVFVVCLSALAAAALAGCENSDTPGGGSNSPGGGMMNGASPSSSPGGMMDGASPSSSPGGMMDGASPSSSSGGGMMNHGESLARVQAHDGDPSLAESVAVIATIAAKGNTETFMALLCEVLVGEALAERGDLGRSATTPSPCRSPPACSRHSA